MKTFLNAIKKYFVDFGTAVAKGDIWCKLSLLVMGAGYWGRKQIVKGVWRNAPLRSGSRTKRKIRRRDTTSYSTTEWKKFSR